MIVHTLARMTNFWANIHRFESQIKIISLFIESLLINEMN
jgi:hypothetical protein